MKQRIGLLFIAITLSGCETLSSVPYPTKFNSLDEKAVSFIRETPNLHLKEFAPQSERPQQDLKETEFLVSVSGGGARAAAFSLGVLAELENLGEWTKPKRKELNILNEVDYFSTVSGGSWGVASYLADRHHQNSNDYKLQNRLSEIKRGFLDFTKEKNSCLALGIENNITKGFKLGDLFIKSSEKPQLPYLFSNTTIAGNQSNFVFSNQYIKHYEINKFYACNSNLKYDVEKGIENLPVSYAVATSGSVPGFYHSIATTKICDKNSDLYDSFFCSQNKSSLDILTLVDGGIYDNYGYQTALEIFKPIKEISKTRKKVIIIIDSNADTEIPFSNDSSRFDLGVGAETLFKAGFPAKTSAFNKMFRSAANAFGINTFVIDFFSASLTKDDLNRLPESKVLDNLNLLKEHAKLKVNCFSDDGEYITFTNDIRRIYSDDCLRNNFYRSGLMGKTTYKFDDYYFTLLVQLGRLAVRLNADKIYNTVYNP
ncbi:MAG: patatin-like phospholipase family protein [Gammaproteobacteria bacterium]|nr:patatin-like phospholipase family protein [Gammaproteobacteria bacterium]